MKKLNITIVALLLTAVYARSQSHIVSGSSEDTRTYTSAKPNGYWKKMLAPEAYELLVNKGTETPYHNPYWNNHKKGIYVSAATGKPMFSSETKFDSGTGWPSFFEPISHVFDDGPARPESAIVWIPMPLNLYPPSNLF